MIRVILPSPLQALAHAGPELHFELAAPVTHRAVLDAVEAAYPMLRGTIRDHATQRRRPFIRNGGAHHHGQPVRCALHRR